MKDKLGGHNASKALGRGAVSEIEEAHCVILQNLSGTCPWCPLILMSLIALIPQKVSLHCTQC